MEREAASGEQVAREGTCACESDKQLSGQRKLQTCCSMAAGRADRVKLGAMMEVDEEEEEQEGGK